MPPHIEAQILRYYHAEKWTADTIARQLHIHRSVVRRVLAQAGLPRIGRPPRPSPIDAYLPFIRQTLQNFPELAASRLYTMVLDHGYRGSPDNFRHHIACLRPRFDASEWMLALLQKKINVQDLKRQTGNLPGLEVLLERPFGMGGTEALFSRKPCSRRKTDNDTLRNAIFKVLHEPPSNYGINRTTWTMPLLRKVLNEAGTGACPDVVRSITRAAGYRWRKARTVLTSADPAYSEKLKRVQSILKDLQSDEAFFSIDEYGPFAIKMRGGRKLTAPGEQNIVPQWQTSRGCLILTAALELSRNQITHFYSDKKNTTEMIKMMEVLVAKYPDRKKIYLSWDAASWHISKQLNRRIEEHNGKVAKTGGVAVEASPLPSGAQFLNVIESVFSGMSRAIIHNSNYPSVDEAKRAIDRHFEERNSHFQQHPQPAGKKIWGKEREPASFSESSNCKDPRYR